VRTSKHLLARRTETQRMQPCKSSIASFLTPIGERRWQYADTPLPTVCGRDRRRPASQRRWTPLSQICSANGGKSAHLLHSAVHIHNAARLSTSTWGMPIRDAGLCSSVETQIIPKNSFALDLRKCSLDIIADLSSAPRFDQASGQSQLRETLCVRACTI